MSIPEKPEQEFYLLSKRDDFESNRLNTQSSLVCAIFNGLLDPSIPEEVYRIADVATGTGIWLDELAAYLGPESGSFPREYHGFDISPDQFPKTHGPEFNFHIHDATKPFPPEYLGTFDLVHARFLVGAFKTPQIKPVITNVLGLLKPGGYLQWDDVSVEDFGAIGPHPKSDRVFKEFRDGLKAIDISHNFPEIIRDMCIEAGFKHVKTEVPNPAKYKELRNELREWSYDLVKATMPPTYTRWGKVKDDVEAREMADGMVSDLREVYGSTDVVPTFPVVRVSGKKV